MAAAVALAAAGGCGNARADGGSGPRRLAVTRVFGEIGLSPGQFTYPRCLDSDGKSVWAIDKAAHVQRLDPATGRATAFWTMPDSAMGKPCGVTVGPEGLLYVADTHYFRVMVYRPPSGLDETPELVAQWGSYGQEPGQFIYPTDVAILPGADGKPARIYVSEYGGNDRVSVFDAEHKFVLSFGRFGDGTGEGSGGVEFNRPQSLGIDAKRGELVVTDACNHRVGVFTLEGKLVRWIGGGAGTGPEQFAYPYGLVLRPDHTALVTEFGNHRVHHVDLETGATLGLYGRPGRGEGELTNPWAIAVIGETVHVLDSGNGRIEAFKAPALVRRTAGGAG
jgi:DNA-binding beta-propeller fold protein YncE